MGVEITALINTFPRGPAGPAGASTWDEITGTATSVPFEPTTAPTHSEGLVYYDETDRSLTYYNEEADVAVNIGREMLIRVRNNSGATIANGKVVYLSGASGQLPTIALARADSESTSRVIGVATHDIENNSFGYVTTVGEVKNLNTSAFADGDSLYLSAATAGELTATAPSLPNLKIHVATVAHSHVSQGKLYVHPEDESVTAGDVQAALVTLETGALTGTVTLTAPVANSGHSYRRAVRVAGAYTASAGTVGSVEVRHAGGDWVALDAVPASGAFDGYAMLPPGSGTLEVRLNKSAVTASVAGVVVGAAVAVIGQSNAAGPATTGTGPTYAGLRGSRMYANPDDATITPANWSWQTITQPTSYTNSAGESVWPAVVNRLEEALGMPVVLVIGDCRGGSGFGDDQWNPGDTLYENSVTVFNASGVRHFEALLCDLGEKDASLDESTADFKAAMLAMWVEFKADVSALTNSRLFAALLATDEDSTTSVGTHQVRQAIIELADDASTGILIGAPRHAGLSAAGATSDPVHTKTAEDMDTVARKWTRAVASYLRGTTDGRGPRLREARLAGNAGLADNELELVFNGAGTLRSISTTGLEITDGGGTKSFTSAVASSHQGRMALRLTASTDFNGAVVGSYGKLMSAITSRMSDDGHPIGLPLEPFLTVAFGTATPTDLTNGLVAYWALSEASGNRADSEGSATLVQTGTVGVATGLLAANAAAIPHDETNLLSTGAGIGALTSGFTISCWVKVPTPGTNASAIGAEIFNNLSSISGGGQARIYLDNRGRVYGLLYGAGNDVFGFRTADGVIDDGAWHHVLLSWTGEALTGIAANDPAVGTLTADFISLEIDGEKQTTAGGFGTNTWSGPDLGNSVVRVGQLAGTAITVPMPSHVEQLGVWSRTLNEAEKTLLRTSPGIAYGDF